MGLLLLAILLATSAQADDGTRHVAERLAAIHQQYLQARSGDDVRGLVTLDGSLRKLVLDPWNRDRTAYCMKGWLPAWTELGLCEDRSTNRLVYSGKLLWEARRLDRSSLFRRFTLFSLVLGEQGDCSFGVMPDVEAAHRYLKQFPSGPFAEETTLILGYFYDDLYKVLRDLHEGRPLYYKLDCYSQYVKDRDLIEQAAEAQRLSIEYYSRVLELRAGPKAEWEETKDIRRWLQEVTDGKARGWYFCAD